MSAISANTVIELFGHLPKADQLLVAKQLTQTHKPFLVDSAQQKKQSFNITPAYLLQKHRAKNTIPAK